MPIISQLINFKNRNGREIIGYFDTDNGWGKPFIVIPPAFGETKRDALKLAYCLVKNGFNVVRYDATDHVGESQGEMVNASFSKMKDDLLSVLDFIQTEYKAEKAGICGTSLGIRVALKAAAEDKRIACICGIVPIVDLRSSLKAVYHQDVIGEILSGTYSGKTIDDIMGFEVSVNFALSAIKDNFHDLDSTRKDVEKLSIPVILMSAENDPWINASDVRAVIDSRPGMKVLLIPAAMHQINENPEAALFALGQAVIVCRKILLGQDTRPSDIQLPSKEELGKQWLIEEGRLKNLLQKSLEGEQQFWEKYLNKFVLIHKSRDYRSFLTDISGQLEIRPGDKVLDAGCGNGHFGGWLMEQMIGLMFREGIRQDQFKPVSYVGLDFVQKSLHEAELKHMNLARRLYRELSLRDKYPLIKYEYVLSDLENRLPFPDGEFDKICCNLVLSYVTAPQAMLNELSRVLKPGGSIMVSSLKPFADLSQIYRNFADATEDQEELDEARKLLSAAGRIKQKENAGIYTFFTGEDLSKLLETAGIGGIKTQRAFADQANLITGVKKG